MPVCEMVTYLIASRAIFIIYFGSTVWADIKVPFKVFTDTTSDGTEWKCGSRIYRHVVRIDIYQLDEQKNCVSCRCTIRTTFETNNATVSIKNRRYSIISDFPLRIRVRELRAKGKLEILNRNSQKKLPVTINAEGNTLDISCHNAEGYPDFGNRFQLTTEISTTPAQTIETTFSVATHVRQNNRDVNKEGRDVIVIVVPLVVTLLIALIAASVVWLYRHKRNKSKDNPVRLTSKKMSIVEYPGLNIDSSPPSDPEVIAQKKGTCRHGRKNSNDIPVKLISKKMSIVEYAGINIDSLAPRDPEVVAQEEATLRKKLEANNSAVLNYAYIDFQSHGVDTVNDNATTHA